MVVVDSVDPVEGPLRQHRVRLQCLWIRARVLVVVPHSEVQREMVRHGPRVLHEEAEHVLDVLWIHRRVELADLRRPAVGVFEVVVALHFVPRFVVETRELHAAFEQMIPAESARAVRHDVVELRPRVGLLFVARRGVDCGRRGVVDDADRVGGRAGLVFVVRLAVHDAERRLVHEATANARVLRLRRRRGVGLHERGDVRDEIGRRVATMAADLVVPQVRHRRFLVR